MRWMIAVCLLCLGAATGAASEPNWGIWAEEVRKQHPLAGSVYSPLREKLDTLPLGKDGVFPGKHSGFILLGEVHDNPIHHQLRARLIELAARGPPLWGRPGIVFEQIRVDQQAGLDRFKALAAAGSGTADDLFRLLEWDKTGWPPAQTYRPLFEIALAAKLPIYAGDPPRDQVRAIARGGLSSVVPEERARLRLDDPMPAPLLDALRQELVGSHCGVLPAAAVEGMAAAQRYRDAHLADVLLSAEERYHDGRLQLGQDALIWGLKPHVPAILIAGNGHVRKDRGVPWHLRLRAPHLRAMTYLIIEVEEGKTDPDAYVPRDPEGKPAADLLIFTPRAKRGDPCEEMRKMKRQ